jgi:hypothetical protein
VSIARSNPIAIEVVGDQTEQLAPQIEALVRRIEDTDNAQATWARKQVDLLKQRFGKRRKKRVPWKGASNINVPMSDGIIRRWKPGITSLVLDANPVAFFKAMENTDLNPSRLTEPFFTWLLIDRIKIAPELIRLVDTVANHGHGYSREGWDWESDREARVIDVDKIFPDGVGAFLTDMRRQLASAAQAQAGQDPLVGQPADAVEGISDEVLIARELAAEYDLSMDDEDDQNMLVQAAQGILQGLPFVKITYIKVVKDQPAWRALSPLQTIAPQDGDPEIDDFFVIIHEMDEDKVRRMARDGYFDERKAAELIRRLRDSDKAPREGSNRDGGAGGAMARQQAKDFMDRRAGVNRTGAIRNHRRVGAVWECFCHLDLNGDGLQERAVMWYSPLHKVVLNTHEYVMPFREWPVTLYKFEAHAERPIDSRGIMELLNELQKLVNAYHNARVDASQIVLAPVIQKRSLASDYAQKVQWRPGAVVPVQTVGDIAPVQMDLAILQGLFQEEQTNQAVAENFIGTFDATINSLQQPAERRTAAEVTAITQLAQNVFGLDARVFQISMGRSMKKLWKLWVEFGPEEVFFRVMDEEQPQRLRKSEVDFEYDISPAGTPSSTNKAFLLASMERILQIVIQDQTGRFDLGAILEQYFKLIDYNLAKLVVRTPEQTQAAQVVQQAAGLSTGNPDLAL